MTKTYLDKLMENSKKFAELLKKEEMKLHKDYKRYINHSKEGALQLITDLAVGYDGYNTIEGLKALIDELRAIALLGLKQKEALDSPDEQGYIKRREYGLFR